jgi:multiple sugar transport system substrate-binding protein
MEEITFSFFDRGRDVPDHIKDLVDQFEHDQGIRVRLETIPWTMGWARMVEVALYHSGPDVSEIGNSWAGDLTRMESLRPFSQIEVKSITGQDEFFPSVWDSVGKAKEDPSAVYSIPWTADARAVIYRRDWLSKAGVDESTAFDDTNRFEQALAGLKSNRTPTPLVLPTKRTSLTIHNLASWVWEAGGSFLSPDNQTILFDQPQALKGSIAYFRLSRFLGEAAHLMNDYDAYEQFYSGKAAVTLGGSWNLHSTAMSEEVHANIGVRPMPGVPFVGGNHLVIWNHTRHEMAALKFIEFLQTEAAAKLIYPQFGLPVRPGDWSWAPFDSPQYQVLKQSIQKGRGFPTGQLWGLVEKRLTDVLADIWANVLKDPEADPSEMIEGQIKGLANRLRLTLGGNPI